MDILKQALRIVLGLCLVAILFYSLPWLAIKLSELAITVIEPAITSAFKNVGK